MRELKLNDLKEFDLKLPLCPPPPPPPPGNPTETSWETDTWALSFLLKRHNVDPSDFGYNWGQLWSKDESNNEWQFIGKPGDLGKLEGVTTGTKGTVLEGLGLSKDLEGRVTELDLSGLDRTYGFEGAPMPPELANLVYLTRLDLGGGNWGGVMPPEYGNLSLLHELDLSGNQVSSGSRKYSLPPEYGNLTLLQRLDVSNNQHLIGLLPRELVNLEYLRVLNFENNDGMRGCLPPLLGDKFRPNLLLQVASTTIDLAPTVVKKIPGPGKKLRQMLNDTVKGQAFKGAIGKGVSSNVKKALIKANRPILQTYQGRANATKAFNAVYDKLAEKLAGAAVGKTKGKIVEEFAPEVTLGDLQQRECAY